MPFVLSADEHSVKSLQEEFEALSSPLTKEDLEYLANGQFEKVKIDLYGLKESLEFVDALKTANR